MKFYKNPILNIIPAILFILVVSLSCKDSSTNGENHNRPPGYSNPYLGLPKPDSTALVFAPGFISTSAFEAGLIVDPNMKQIYYMRFASLTATPEIYTTLELENGWIQPSRIFAGTYYDVLSAISSDGNTLYFYSDRPTQYGSGNILNHSDIWTMERGVSGWGAMQNLGPTINSSIREMSPSVCQNKTMYFHKSDGNFLNQIYFSTFTGGVYSTPVLLGNEINSSGDAHNPCIAPDESYLIFTSYKSGGFGNADLYISFKKPDGTWTQVKNMGAKVNSASQDDYATISPDGKYLFFASDRNSAGMCDIFWISTSIIEKLK